MKQPFDLTEEEKKKEWDEIEQLILTYQTQFNGEESNEAKEAGNILINRFSPLFKKYITLIKYNQIDFEDFEMKQFVWLFMDDYNLKKALGRKKQSTEHKSQIYKKFNFVIETFGQLSEEDIISDLYMCFLTVAKRYKQTGRNFCAYLYNVYRHEVARHIKKHIKNPLNIQYKNLKYEDCVNGEHDIHIDLTYEDNYYESMTGLPDHTWIAGQSCGEAFAELTPSQRKILIKYYLEDWNDRQISENTGSHINTVNQKRRDALDQLCKTLNIPKSELKRNRKSGKKASLPTT
jgi:RNA polymerase sigma factor (sigma-70 family)